MAYQSFFFDFEEMPVTVDGGFDLGSMEGRADISYDREGTWAIEGIQLLGSKRLNYAPGERLKLAALGEPAPNYEKNMIWLDRGTSLFLMLHEVLENKWHSNVQDAVMERLVEDHAEAGHRLADYKRDQMMEERL
jgi:hypothetical protein